MQRSYATGKRPCVIGGGYVFSHFRTGLWGHVLAPFRIPGAHFLNAVGVGGKADYSYAKDYKYLSVRDEVSRAALAPSLPGKEIRLVPCPAVLLEIPRFGYFRNVPGGEMLKRYKIHEYVVVDVEAQWATEFVKEPVVPVDTRPWMKKKWNGRPVEFQTRSPEMVLALMSGAKAVITESLHMSIMAMAINVPFAVSLRGGTAGKPASYFTRAGFSQVMRKPSKSIVGDALRLLGEMQEVRKAEQGRARQHLDDMVRLMD